MCHVGMMLVDAGFSSYYQRDAAIVAPSHSVCLNQERKMEEASAADGGGCCCCFWIPFSGGRPSSEGWKSTVHGMDGSISGAGGWWRRGMMKVREWSEIVAGPRWKTFIRRFNRSSRQGSGGRREWKKFQYDPLSYSLNFDDGREDDESPDGEMYRNFSSRFAAVPGSAISSNLAGRDPPPAAVH